MNRIFVPAGTARPTFDGLANIGVHFYRLFNKLNFFLIFNRTINIKYVISKTFIRQEVNNYASQKLLLADFQNWATDNDNNKKLIK